MKTDPLPHTDQSPQPVAIPPSMLETPHVEELLKSDWDRAITAAMHEVEIPKGLEGRIWTSLQQANNTTATQETSSAHGALVQSAATATVTNLPRAARLMGRAWSWGSHRPVYRRLIAGTAIVLALMAASAWWSLTPPRWTTTAAAQTALAALPPDGVTDDRIPTPAELQSAARVLPAGWNRDDRWAVMGLQPLRQTTAPRTLSASEPITVELRWAAAGVDSSQRLLLVSLPRSAVAVRSMPMARSAGSAEIVYGGSAAWMSWQEQERVFVLCSPEGADLLEQIRTALQRTSQLG